MTQPIRIVLIDNVDSFSYNLVDELRQLGYPLVVYRNQLAAANVIKQLESYQGQQLVCLSPGPGHPANAGNLMDIVRFCSGRIPMLGICLGFQALVELYGGRVDTCGEIVHGKTAVIDTIEHAVFTNATDNNQCVVARYHSLSGYDLPESVKIIAQINGPEGTIPMAAEFIDGQDHSDAVGFQFHPESLLTPKGKQLLSNSIHYLLEGAKP
ncbi:anthranilate synthase component II [Idiomarina sp. 29L]|uniref:anthranilate synthase component II n=1 Tax=Idiomarina sp. 29L TaxID=2508877 RepID=UPI0010109578|nr:gamma-glutamyl-gamma-aminobutyrate hydrolase family protein [Idiomarina sp. 29L]RXS42040.1 anthranilate synthase component II [Idiomarina sp. 29L]